MTDAAMISIVAQVCTTAAAIAAGYFAYRAKAVAIETHRVVNSRVDEFLAMAKKSFRAEGVLEEKQAEAGRKSAIANAAETHESIQPATDRLAKAIKDVPEKTATKVVEKLAEK